MPAARRIVGRMLSLPVPPERLVELLQELWMAGPHRVVWNGRDQAGRDMPSGIYFYRMRTTQFEQTYRMTLIR